MDGSEPLEWSIDIEYCRWANFFMGCATSVYDGQYTNIFRCVMLQPMWWRTNLVSNVTKTIPLGLFMTGIEFHMSILCGSWWKRILAYMMLCYLKIWQKQGCRWLWVCWIKNKIAIHGPGRYCLFIRYMDGSEPLEWRIDIEYCHWANFFMVCATLVY